MKITKNLEDFIEAIESARLALESVANDSAFQKLCGECQTRVEKARKLVEQQYGSQ